MEIDLRDLKETNRFTCKSADWDGRFVRCIHRRRSKGPWVLFWVICFPCEDFIRWYFHNIILVWSWRHLECHLFPPLAVSQCCSCPEAQLQGPCNWRKCWRTDILCNRSAVLWFKLGSNSSSMVPLFSPREKEWVILLLCWKPFWASSSPHKSISQLPILVKMLLMGTENKAKNRTSYLYGCDSSPILQFQAYPELCRRIR